MFRKTSRHIESIPLEMKTLCTMKITPSEGNSRLNVTEGKICALKT